MPSRTDDKYMMRLPDGLRDIIKQKAKENMRSMNADMIFNLENIYRPKEKSQNAE